MSDETKLLQCPFCGGEAALGKCTMTRDRNMNGDKGTFTGHFVNCIMCGSSNQGVSEGWRSPEEGAAHWNKRVQVQQ